MIHYLLLKFKPGFFSDEVFSMAVEVFTGIGKALAGIEDVQVSRNCIPRDTNADLLVRMTLEGHEALRPTWSIRSTVALQRRSSPVYPGA